MKNKLTFYQWLRLQKDQDDLVGDLARDALETHDSPRGSAGYQAWRNLIVEKAGIHAAGLEALDLAWAEYQDFLASR